MKIGDRVKVRSVGIIGRTPYDESLVLLDGKFARVTRVLEKLVRVTFEDDWIPTTTLPVVLLELAPSHEEVAAAIVELLRKHKSLARFQIYREIHGVVGGVLDGQIQTCLGILLDGGTLVETDEPRLCGSSLSLKEQV